MPLTTLILTKGKQYSLWAIRTDRVHTADLSTTLREPCICRPATVSRSCPLLGLTLGASTLVTASSEKVSDLCIIKRSVNIFPFRERRISLIADADFNQTVHLYMSHRDNALPVMPLLFTKWCSYHDLLIVVLPFFLFTIAGIETKV